MDVSDLPGIRHNETLCCTIQYFEYHAQAEQLRATIDTLFPRNERNWRLNLCYQALMQERAQKLIAAAEMAEHLRPSSSVDDWSRAAAIDWKNAGYIYQTIHRDEEAARMFEHAIQNMQPYYVAFFYLKEATEGLIRSQQFREANAMRRRVVSYLRLEEWRSIPFYRDVFGANLDTTPNAFFEPELMDDMRAAIQYSEGWLFVPQLRAKIAEWKQKHPQLAMLDFDIPE